MKDNLKKIWIWFIIVPIASVIGIIIINNLFKWHSHISFIEAEWTAGDALAFFGTFLASIISVLGIYITSYISQKRYRDDIKRSVLPVLSLNILNRTYINAFESIFNKKAEATVVSSYREEKLNNLYFETKSGNISMLKSLSKKQAEALKQNGMVWQPLDNGSFVLEDKRVLSIVINIENIGKGAAMNFRLGINNKNIKPDCRKYTYPQSLVVGESIHITLFCIDTQVDDYGEFIMEFFYYDIYNNGYKQQYQINIQNSNNKPTLIVDTEFKQEAIIK